MKADRLKELFYNTIDPVFYPDISQARRVSNELLKAARGSDTGVTIRINQSWRRHIVRHDLRFNISQSREWFANLAQDIQGYAANRNRAEIKRSIDFLSKQGAILN